MSQEGGITSNGGIVIQILVESAMEYIGSTSPLNVKEEHPDTSPRERQRMIRIRTVKVSGSMMH